jgi:hypothetical protein
MLISDAGCYCWSLPPSGDTIGNVRRGHGTCSRKSINLFCDHYDCHHSSQLPFVMSNDAAVCEGLTFRPHEQTLQGALEHGAESTSAYGLPESVEQAQVAASQNTCPCRYWYTYNHYW